MEKDSPQKNDGVIEKVNQSQQPAPSQPTKRCFDIFRQTQYESSA
jgi:hypothetical protein